MEQGLAREAPWRRGPGASWVLKAQLRRQARGAGPEP